MYEEKRLFKTIVALKTEKKHFAKKIFEAEWLLNGHTSFTLLGKQRHRNVLFRRFLSSGHAKLCIKTKSSFTVQPKKLECTLFGSFHLTGLILGFHLQTHKKISRQESIR